MNVRNVRFLSYFMIIAIIIITVSAYPQLPEKIAVHWNGYGTTDSYYDKVYGIIIIPIIAFALLVLLSIIPSIDPLKENIEKFRIYYEWFIVVMLAFLSYAQILIMLWNYGMRFSMIAMLSPAIGLLFIYIGILMENAKRNWFIGIRTPWTLSHDRVWERTHKIGGRLLKVSGIIAMIATFMEDRAIILIIVPIIAAMIYSVAYSYWLYRKIEKSGKEE